MQVILLERIENLGQMGDEVAVRPGFARNFLLPQKKALRATEANRTYFQKQRAQLEAANLERRKDAEAAAKKLDGVKVVIIRQASETGLLYGSVSTRDVTDALANAKVNVDRRQVLLDRPIKTLGLHPVRISLHPEVSVNVIANVAKSEEEAAQQEKQGSAVTAAEDTSDEVAEILAAIDAVEQQDETKPTA